MNRAAALVLLATGAGLAGLLYARRANAARIDTGQPPERDGWSLPELENFTWSLPELPTAAADFVGDVVSNLRGWTGTPEKYRADVEAAERANGIPAGLLSRLLYQESRFKPDAVNKKSGAQGIAQVMPATARDPGFGVAPLANPFDAPSAIRFAGAYLAAMRRYVGTWGLALAAYNWGPGYVKTRSRSAWPAETVDYVRDITADVPVTV